MIEILGVAFGIFKTWLDGRQTLAKAKIDTQLAREENNARLLRDEASYNNEWEQSQLLDSDKWLRRICFVIFSAPFVIAYFNPTAVSDYFEIALNLIPEWYIKTYIGIVGAVWGISVLRNPIKTLFRKG